MRNDVYRLTRLRAYGLTGKGLASIWQVYGKYMARGWQVYGKYMASSTKALDLANSWQLLYDYLPDTWVRGSSALPETLMRR